MDSALALADLRSLGRVQNESQSGEEVTQEHDKTMAEISAVTGEDRILDTDRVLQRTLEIRAAYLQPVSYLQVDLLARHRATRSTDAGLRRALLLTVNCVAAGMRNTG